MPSLKLTKTAVETAKPAYRDYEMRDTTLAGFLCKVTPAGRKVFMLQYRTPTGERRKPSLGVFGQLTVDQARKLAQEHLAAVRAGEDASQERQDARGAPTVKDLSELFMTEYSEARNKPSSIATNRLNLRLHVLPEFGRMKVAEVKRPGIAALIGRMRDTPAAANHTLSLLGKMFNLAELWGMRPDGTNPCRHVQKYTGQKRTRLIIDVRSLALDPVVVRQNWLEACDYATDRGAAVLNEYARAADPFGKVGRQSVAIEVTSVVRASPTSFQICRIERRYENNALAGTERWTAILSIVLQPPRSEAQLRKNPLGIYVNGLNWTRELGSSGS